MAGFGDLNRVNTNVQALDAQLSLNKINRDLANNQLRLSTGLRINRAEDDAAGYSIGTKLRSRVAGLEQALQNVGDAKSVLDIAEASFSTVMDSLIEMKALATQAANSTLGAEERQFIADQITELAKDINKVADQTVFQDTQLLNGAVVSSATGSLAVGDSTFTGDLVLTFQVGERAEDILEANIRAVNVGELFFASANSSIGTGALGATAGAITVTQSGITGGEAVAGLIEFGTGANAATADDFRVFMGSIDKAITLMAERVNAVGMVQSSLSTRELTLSQAISANQAATSRIMDADFAKEQSESIRLQIMQQTATAALAQANMSPQSVLSFLA